MCILPSVLYATRVDTIVSCTEARFVSFFQRGSLTIQILDQIAHQKVTWGPNLSTTYLSVNYIEIKLEYDIESRLCPNHRHAQWPISGIGQA